MAERMVAITRPGRNATANVPRLQRAAGKPRRTAATATTIPATTAKAKPVNGDALPSLTVWLARIHAPSHGRNVPTIHQTGWYHQLLPPPISYQRLVYVPIFWRRVTSRRR